MIRGFVGDKRPFVRTLISLPRDSASVPVDMLLDTGSHLTIISRDVLDTLGVDLSRLSSARRIRAAGIGGPQEYLRVRLIIAFPTSTAELHPLPIWVSVPLSIENPVGSILGMEALVDFRLTVAAGQHLVELEPLF